MRLGPCRESLLMECPELGAYWQLEVVVLRPDAEQAAPMRASWCCEQTEQSSADAWRAWAGPAATKRALPPSGRKRGRREIIQTHCRDDAAEVTPHTRPPTCMTSNTTAKAGRSLKEQY